MFIAGHFYTVIGADTYVDSDEYRWCSGKSMISHKGS